MYTLTAQNKYGEQLELTHNEAYVIESIEGLDPPDAVINTTRNANADGSVYNSAYVDNRQIIITLAINGPAEANRINLYKYFKAKYPVRLYYKNNTRNVYIDGYVKSMQIELFNKKQIAQITILCPEPFFNSSTNDLTDFSSVESLFEFPFSVEESGNLLEVTATDTTIQGIDFTVNDDGTVNVDGTATANAYLVLGAVSLIGGQTYKLTGCPTGGGNSTYRLYWQGVSGNYDEGEGTTYTPQSDTTVNIRIVVYSGATVNNLEFKPMVRLVSVESDTYMEYCDPDGLIEFSTILLEQEKDIINNGDVETGFIIYLKARGPVTNPTIYNSETNEYIKLSLSMAEGDVIYINTKKKQKTIQLTSNGVTTNIIGNLVNGSTWFTLSPGDNLFIVTADTTPENLDAYTEVTDLFEGV
jgi:hypothetical protein